MIGDIAVGKAHHLIKYRQGIAHPAVRLLGYDVKGFRFGGRTLALRHVLQVIHDVGNGDAGKVVDLATGEDGRNHLVLLGGRQNKKGMTRRFFQRFEESIESRRTEHVHLINDKDLIPADGRRNAHLLNERADVLHRIVGSRIQFMYIIGTLLVESRAGFAGVAGFALRRGSQAVDCFCKDAGAGGFSYPARSAKQVGVRQLVVLYGIF
ncbi:hypothetical protein Barb6XT_01301 [Bacteroidales bacterium Barb6XT]|nr:hypothetical protein Barb6XT_01301 [Bacteroidales bacterium Barb6XT]